MKSCTILPAIKNSHGILNRAARRRTCSSQFPPCRLFLIAVLILPAAALLSCISPSVKAEEYYALGAAYFELKKYPEAESWFTRAKFYRTTKTASEYNLGRIAYETGRYKKAADYFEAIIRRDGENVTALRALAYTYIKLEEPGAAEMYYRRVLALVPESYDDGYNYALVLFALGRAEETETVLVKYNNTEDPALLLLLARSQKEQEKPEALDAYNASLLKKDDPAVRAEYAAYLAAQGHKQKALEEYRKALESAVGDQKEKIQVAMEELEGQTG